MTCLIPSRTWSIRSKQSIMTICHLFSRGTAWASHTFRCQR
uniref:Uncharacterized protein n=1 Tax=Arundo donax TaxID=35708 RepID=A0A0A9E7Y6_ARUDO